MSQKQQESYKKQSYHLSKEIAKWIAEQAKRTGRSKSWIVRKALECPSFRRFVDQLPAEPMMTDDDQK